MVSLIRHRVKLRKTWVVTVGIPRGRLAQIYRVVKREKKALKK